MGPSVNQNNEVEVNKSKVSLYRASLFDILDEPSTKLDDAAVRYFEDGLLVVEDGFIKDIGPYQELIGDYKEQELIDYSGHLIMPGFIDTHIHYPQIELIGSYGTQLLEWLNKYTFPTEEKFSDASYATKIVDLFLDQLLINGTTSALVFCTKHKQSVERFFSASHKRNLRMIAGQVLMDRNAPKGLLTDDLVYQESQELINRWHNQGRQSYALTPRFAVTSSEEQLKRTQTLFAANPGVYLHSHVSESKDELDLVKQLFPWSKNYLDVYDHFDLISERSIFAHGNYLSKEELSLLKAKGGKISHCPTSNLFLGSGLFPAKEYLAAQVPFALATDVGGGTSFSMFKTMQEFYKVSALQQLRPTAFQCFYLSTLGAARLLDLDDKIGNFELGKEADFVVVDLSPDPLQEIRQSRAHSIHDSLFSLMIMGDDRNIKETFVAGRPFRKNLSQ